MRAAAPTRLERLTRAVLRRGRRVPGLRTVLLHPVIARPGYWFVTGSALVWSGVLGLGRWRSDGGLIVAEHMPRWSFGRGGTTIGAVFLTRGRPTANVLAHEAIHRAQWRRYGLVFPLLYAAAGQNPFRNRFEIEAGLALGNYVRPGTRSSGTTRTV
ncbi:hypothetical protein [Salinibacterium sp. ZJ454]|uniref:hypothetical protein n=1 Tax=Salinibacterium sp. ZJ454 TaxID=2708339 RepID=UPI0014211ACA|nr:hypothetical protein [Salinibacterium sp. ZJ454]